MSTDAPMTLEQWNKYVDDSNERFLAAPMAEKRVMLAEDTLKQLKNERIVPMSKYLLLKGTTDIYTNAELRDTLKQESRCCVCGIGALFISAVQRLDKLGTGAFFGAADPQWAIHKYMGVHGLFSRDELIIIENFFENCYTGLTRMQHMEIAMRVLIETKGGPVDEPFRARLYREASEMLVATSGMIVATRSEEVTNGN